LRVWIVCTHLKVKLSVILILSNHDGGSHFWLYLHRLLLLWLLLLLLLLLGVVVVAVGSMDMVRKGVLRLFCRKGADKLDCASVGSVE
jgi:hypothetical protein